MFLDSSFRLAAAAAAGGLFVVASAPEAHAADFASSVVAYTPGAHPGTDAPFKDAQAALGPVTDNTQFGALTPFNPPFNPPAGPSNPSDHGQIVIVGPGGSLTLKLATPVATAGGMLGVFSNNGIVDVSDNGSGLAGNPVGVFATNEITGDNVFPKALVSVSGTGLTGSFVQLGSSPQTFDNPTNYWADAKPYTGWDPTVGTIAADQSKPFLGDISDFADKDAQAIQQALDGSAGGTWLNLTGVSPTQVQYVRFDVPAGADYRLVLDAVSAVPEPAFALPLLACAAVAARRRRSLA